MMRATQTGLLLSLGTCLLACTPSIEDYPRELEEAVCDWQHDCHAYERRSDCIAARTIDADPAYDYLLRAVAAGNLEYDREAAADCLDAIRGRGCEERDPEPEPVCERVFVGKVGRNAPCMSTAECAGNAVCGFDPTCTEMCCVGHCRVLPEPLAIGAACGGAIDCVPEAFCSFDPMTGNQACAARVKIGGDCSAGQVCVLDARCDGQRCREVPIAQPGEPCGDALVECAEGSDCILDVDRGRPFCVAPLELGAPCDPDGAVRCGRFDTYCDPASRLCTLLPGPGQGCSEGTCLPYATCEGDPSPADGSIGRDPTCVRKAGPGESCGFAGADQPYVECLGDLQCVADTCELREPVEGPDCPVPK